MTALAAKYKTARFTSILSFLNLVNKEKVNAPEFGEPASQSKRLSPSLSLSYALIPARLHSLHDLRIRASVKDGYRVPTFDDLYYVQIGNKNLDTEKAMQYSMGLSYVNPSLLNFFRFISLSIDAYYNKVEDKIVAIPKSMYAWSMQNKGEVNIYGSDVNLNTYFFLSSAFMFNLTANYTFQKAIDMTDPKSKTYKHQLPYTPNHTANFNITCNTPLASIGYTASIISKRYSLAQNIKQNEIDGYMDQNISLSRDFQISTVNVGINVEMLNITNKNYDVIKFYPMAGRQFRGKLRLNF